MGPDSHDIHPPRTSATASSLASTLLTILSQAHERVMIGICGAPGAGKSTLAAAIATELGPDIVTVVPFDGFHLATSVIAGTPLQSRRGAVDTFDTGSYRALVRRLRVRDEDVVFAPSFDRRIEESIASSIAIPRRIPLILTEGNYLLADEPNLRATRAMLDAVWYLDTPPEVRLPQLVARHVAFGKPRMEAAAWAAGTDQRNAEMVERTRSLADLIITMEP